MKIVRIIGGLGNQMFQYALYLALKQHFPEETVLVDASLMKSYNVHNGLELERVFGVELPQASFRQLAGLTRPTYNYKLARFIEKILPPRRTELLEAKDYTFRNEALSSGNLYYRGYWQNCGYFLDVRTQILEAYQFVLPQNEPTRHLLADLLNDEQSVSVHIRRGDYLKAPNYAGLCGIDYYSRALEYIKTKLDNPTFYIFSDDIEWCKDNILPLIGESKHVIVDWNRGSDSALDMMIMSKCKHNIIANSSFSWWSAFLNDNKGAIVCAPDKWTNTKVNCKFQLPFWILF